MGETLMGAAHLIWRLEEELGALRRELGVSVGGTVESISRP